MMSSPLRFLSLVLAFLQLQKTYAGNGYHYDRPNPSISAITNSIDNSGHHFAPLPTVSPLPPVPALPPLPTPRNSNFQTQSLVQTHPPPQSTYTALKSIANSYRPPSAPQLPNKYLPPSAPAYNNAPVYSKTPNPLPGISLRFAEVAPQPQSSPGIFGHRLQPSGPSGPSAPAFPTAPYVPTAPAFSNAPASLPQAAPQPLRIPFGKQAVVHLPPTGPTGGDVYELGGRQLKQYAVIEIIENDIEHDMRPFLATPFGDNYRAQIGASGTGAVPSAPGQQINSRSNALVLEQQRLAQQRSSSANDAVALGSGGLGFVRLPNGNVYLGSGSLGYISGQQHTALIQEARTRTGARVPDALHFGHGPLGNPGNQQGSTRFRY